MRVRMMTLMAGPDGCVQPGAEIDVPEAEAQALVSGGFAEALEQPKNRKGGAADAVQRARNAGKRAGNGGNGARKAAPAAGGKRK